MSHAPGASRALPAALYVAILTHALMQAAIGGSLPLMRAEIPMTHAVEGWHITGLALGGLIAASVAEPLRRRVGRWWLVMGAVGVAVVAAALFASAQSPAQSIAACVLFGMGVSATLIAGQTLLVAADPVHGAQRISEFNVAYSVGAVIASAVLPLVAGAWSWRVFPVLQIAVFLAAVVPALLSVRGAAQAVPAGGGRSRSGPDGGPQARRPRLVIVVMCLAVTVEWALVFWLATYLVSVGGLAPERAAAVVPAMFVTILVGRVTGRAVLARFGAGATLVGSMVLALAAFAVLAVAHTGTAVAAAVVAGAATANVYPACIALTVQVYPSDPDPVVARASQLTSMCSVIFPLLFGVLADQIGLGRAFVLPPILAVAAIAMVAAVGVRRAAPLT